MTWYEIYLLGLVLTVPFYYWGAVRGKAKTPELMSLIFGAFWFITIPMLIYQLFKK